MLCIVKFTGYILYTYIHAAFVVYVSSLLIINICMPIFLMKVYPYKLKLSGPWDCPDIVEYTID